MKPKYKIKTYESAQNKGEFIASIEWWSPWPGTPSKTGDIKFGFACLNNARKWANQRLTELKKSCPA